MTADLHLHTRFSDGTYSPEQLVEQARLMKLAAIAVTDHDTLEGCAPTAVLCASAGIEFLPGVELTAEHEGHEIHILGYLMDITHPVMLSEMEKFQMVRQQRVVEIVSRLNGLGVPLRSEAVFAIANCKSPGRPHVARALVDARVCRTADEAFERFLKKHRPAYVPKFKMSAAQAIELIQSAGGLAVLAHPGLNQADDFIPGMAEAGLDGIECFHTKHSTSATERYLEMADRFHLLVTGGSDCHGWNKGRPVIGTVTVPYACVQKLKAKALERCSR
jgi:3',5'-nucleoside bisphosphate phosphatase